MRKESLSILLVFSIFFMTTKLVISVNFSKLNITNQKISFNIFIVENLLNIFMEHDLNILMIFGLKEKFIIFTNTMYLWLLLQSRAE